MIRAKEFRKVGRELLDRSYSTSHIAWAMRRSLDGRGELGRCGDRFGRSFRDWR